VYEQFYGLRELPFDLTSNPRYLCLTAKHREALSNLKYGILGRRGVTLLIGEAGLGKTTLVRAALESEELKGGECVCLSNPTLTRGEFIEFLAHSFGLSERARESKTTMLIELEQVLKARRAQGSVSALLVDEAQALSPELLEEVRLLANIETNTDKLLPVVLAGHPQLARRLEEPELRQLKQRIALRCDLQPLNLRETMGYIAGRVRIAGGNCESVFTRDAMELVHHGSRGIPRTISVICDNALVNGFAANQTPVDWEVVAEVCRDFEFSIPMMRRNASAPAPELQPVSSRTTERQSMFSMFTRRRFSFF
jgi:type II secretory pathway predicted ATPase ExeA